MRTTLFLAASLCFIQSGVAVAAPKNPYGKYDQRKWVPVKIWGYSQESCAAVLNGVSASQRAATELYVLGLWSGMNLASDVSVGHSTDGPGIMGDVELQCQARPSENLVDAILDVRQRFVQAGK